jgi:hypothetical protein
MAADRGIELVTPAGSDPDVRPGGGAATPSGNVVCFNTELAIAGSPLNGLVTADDGFCSRRTPSGWTTEWVTGPPIREPQGGRGAQVYYVSPDGARTVFASDMGIFPDYPGPPTGGAGGGTLSAFMSEAGQTRWLAPTPQPLPEGGDQNALAFWLEREPLAATVDLRHGIFSSVLQLLPEDQNSGIDVYEWTPDGIRLVTSDPATGRAIGGAPAIGSSFEQLQAEPGSISADGSRIFFERRDSALAGAPADVRSVFLRDGDAIVHVSPRRGPGPAADVRLAGAYDDGAVVYLVTEEQLTPEAKEAGPALYRYDIGSDELGLVATDPNGIYFLGASGDGETVAYRTGALDLHVIHDGTDATLGTFFATDTFDVFDGPATERSDKRSFRISSDGDTIVFSSGGGFDGVTPGLMRVFRWTAEDGVRWISRAADGAEPAADATVGNFSTNFPGRARQQISNTMRVRPNVGRVMSDDGRRVFFETRDALVAADVNGFIDVYEWSDGNVRLVSPGTQRDDALYHDSSADGGTVFFVTRAALIPELDRNISRDLYAAREGGGFALPPAPVPCSGEACQGEPPASPQTPSPGSSRFDGPGDEQEAKPGHRLSKLNTRQIRTFARTGRTVLTVRANRTGVVTATVQARVTRRTLVVARSMRVARDGATVRLPLKLSRQARRALRQRGRLRLVISVGYSESATTLRQVVVLRG